jgi:hypothetical protein
MPLVFIVTQPDYHPADGNFHLSYVQALVAAFGDALPGLFIENAANLHLEDGTPEEGVQVAHWRFGRTKNAPNIWVVVIFAEGDLAEDQQIEAKATVKQMIDNWFIENDGEKQDNIALDCFWNSGHGFFRLLGKAFDW